MLLLRPEGFFLLVDLREKNFRFMVGGTKKKNKLEDLKVLRRSPDLLNNVKIGQSQLQLIMEKNFVLPYMGVADILVK